MRAVRGPGARPDGPGSAERRGFASVVPVGRWGSHTWTTADGDAPCPGATGRSRPRPDGPSAGTAPRRTARRPGGPAGRRCRPSNRTVRTRSPTRCPGCAMPSGPARRGPGDSDDPAAEPVRPGLPAEVTPAPEVSSGSRDRPPDAAPPARPGAARRRRHPRRGVRGDRRSSPSRRRRRPRRREAAAPDGAAADTWAQRATVALASVNRQLDTLAQTEDEWRRLPESGRAVVPAPVAALEERRSVLQRRRATLQAQLDDYRSLRRTQQELANSEQHLRAVETALADAPPRRRRSAEQEAAIAALEEQRDLRIRRRDVQRTELASLQDGVSTATRTPLPDDGAATAKITDDVMEMVHNGGTEPTRPDPKPPRPEVVAGRESEDGKPRQEVGTSGPPDPRGPRDESDERRAAKEKRAAEAAATGPPTTGPHGSSRQKGTAPRSTPTSTARRRSPRTTGNRPRSTRPRGRIRAARSRPERRSRSPQSEAAERLMTGRRTGSRRTRTRRRAGRTYRQTEMRAADRAKVGEHGRGGERSALPPTRAGARVGRSEDRRRRDTDGRGHSRVERRRHKSVTPQNAQERDSPAARRGEERESTHRESEDRESDRPREGPRLPGPRFQGPRLQGSRPEERGSTEHGSDAARVGRPTAPATGTTRTRSGPTGPTTPGTAATAVRTVAPPPRTGDPDRAGPPRAGAGGRRDGSGAVVAAWRRRSVPRHRYRHPL